MKLLKQEWTGSQSRGVLAMDLQHRADPQQVMLSRMCDSLGVLSQGSDSPTPLLLRSDKKAFQGLHGKSY